MNAAPSTATSAAAFVAEAASSAERRVARRVGVIWALLFFDVLGGSSSLLVPIPHKLTQAMTQGALVVAAVLVVTINPRLRVRPNLFLGIYSVLAAETLMMSVRLVSFGTTYRAVRFLLFLGVLWLLTPWFGRRDMLILRSHLRVLVAIVAMVWLGFAIAPGKAYQAHRLGGAIWNVPPTQVAHYTAELIGLVALIWLCGLTTRRTMLIIVVPVSYTHLTLPTNREV